MKILAAHDGGTGCAWYRMLVPLRELEKHGHEITWRATQKLVNVETSWPLLREGDEKGHDLIIGQRLCTFDSIPYWNRYSTTPGMQTVYELDDDLFRVTPANEQAYNFYSKESARESARLHIRRSSLLTVTTEYLADALLQEAGANIPHAVLPNYIPEWVLDLPRDTLDRRMRLGWIGGASHVQDLKLVAKQIGRFLERVPDWDLYLCGHDFRALIKAPPNRRFHVPWINIVDTPKLYYRSIDYDIGICPLLNGPFDQAKSYIKALEYASRGIPVVASDVRPYREFVKHGETGFLVKYEHEWLKYLSLLASDEDLRLKMGAAAKEQAREHTIEKHWQKWEQAYTKLFPEDWKFQG